MKVKGFLRFFETGWLAVLILMAAMFIFYTTPVEDGDFFWHVRTGQWILDHGKLPSEDHFSYTTGQNDSQRIEFILKQYWVSQVLLYKLWDLAGATGIVLFRALAYTGILLFMLLWMRTYSKGWLPMVFIFLVGVLLREYPNERPQIFSFLFFPLVLFLLERLRSDKFKHPFWLYCLLPLFMLLWGNMHAAYLLGVGIILIYLSSHLILALAGKETVRPAYAATLGLSAAAPFCNPTGIISVSVFFESSDSYISSIYENISPFSAAVDFKDYYPAYWISLVLILILVLPRARKMHLAHLGSVAALVALSLTGLRHMYYLLAVFPLVAIYHQGTEMSRRQAVAVTVALLVWLPMAKWSRVLDFSIDRTFPVKGAAFIRDQKPAGNLFNYYGWGGYLMLATPENPVFIDGRGLREQISKTYDEILWQPRGDAYLEAYGVGVVVMPGISLVSGELFPLINDLISSNRWSLVYMDEVSLIFALNTPANKTLISRYGMDKSMAYKHVILLSDLLIKEGVDRSALWYSRAIAFQKLGETKKARQSALKALNLNPDDARPRALLPVE